MPAPVDGKRFGTRRAAVKAARLAREYRDALRRYDPGLPYHDLIVCDDSWARYSRAERRQESDDDRETDARSLVEYCHEIAGTIFTILVARDFEELKRDVMGTYLELADTVSDRDEVCRRIVEHMVTEFDRRLTPAEQATILDAAAGRLSPVSTYGDPLDVVLSHLRTTSLITEYRVRPDPAAPAEGARRWQVTLAGYALRSDGGRLPTLPIALDLRRQRPATLPSLTRARPVDDQTWELQLVADAPAEPESYVSVPAV